MLLAFAFGQAGLLMHALAHGQIIGSRWQGVLYATTDLLLGWCTKGWKLKHEAHHASPNSDEDPDIHLGFIALTHAQAQTKQGLYRFTTRYQHLLLPLLLLFMAPHLRYASIRYALKQEMAWALVSVCLMGVHMAAYLWMLFFFLPIWTAIAFAAVHNGLLGLYLGGAFVVNHTGRPIEERPGIAGDYLRVQVETARNISGGWWATALFGGLNFQIEHHLFSGMPHYNLRKATGIVRPFCEARDITYRSVGLCAAYREVYRHLRDVAQAAN